MDLTIRHAYNGSEITRQLASVIKHAISSFTTDLMAWRKFVVPITQ
jgi:hypothetical protein